MRISVCTACGSVVSMDVTDAQFSLGDKVARVSSCAFCGSRSPTETSEGSSGTKPDGGAGRGTSAWDTLPLLGEVGRMRAGDQGALVADSIPRFQRSFQQVGALLQARLKDATSRVVAFLSAERRAGTTTVTANVGAALSHGRSKVLLINANLRSAPPTEGILRNKIVGLSLLLENKVTPSGSLDDPSGETEIDESYSIPVAAPLEIGDLRAMQALGVHEEEEEAQNARPRRGAPDTTFWRKVERISFPIPKRNLTVIPAGAPPEDPQYLLGSPWMGKLIALSRKLNDFVLIDCPCLEQASDALVLAPLVDAFVVVHRTTGNPQQTKEALRAVAAACGTVAGVIVNDAPES